MINEIKVGSYYKSIGVVADGPYKQPSHKEIHTMSHRANLAVAERVRFIAVLASRRRCIGRRFLLVGSHLAPLVLHVQ